MQQAREGIIITNKQNPFLMLELFLQNRKNLFHCAFLRQEYKEFLASATERFNQLTVQQKAQAESLKKTRAEEATLTASIEAEDEEIRKKQEELKQKDKEIAAKRDALMGEMKNVSALKETMGVEKIELERTLVNDVVSKLKEVLSLLGDG